MLFFLRSGRRISVLCDRLEFVILYAVIHTLLLAVIFKLVILSHYACYIVFYLVFYPNKIFEMNKYYLLTYTM